MTDPLADLTAAGVAVWLDDLSRERLSSGDLADLIADRQVVGVTTNPTIFQKALAEGQAYDDQVRDLALRGVDVGEAVRALTSYDVRWACDVLAGVAERTGGVDGRVSIEVDPRISGDCAQTLAEARALWWLVDRPNLFIKIPATVQSLPAITAALAEGISVNVTLIFSLARYQQVIEAFLDGIEQAGKAGHDLSRIGSVASFFVSRVDTEVDKRLAKTADTDSDSDSENDSGGNGQGLRGTAAIANARLAYQLYEQAFSSARWQELAAAGARPQRPLWASTGVKDPTMDDTRYVVDLVAPGTVNTMPEATLNAVHDHGKVLGDSITSEYAAAQQALDALRSAGIDLEDVVAVLEDEGVSKFEDSWEQLLDSTAAQLKAAGADPQQQRSAAGTGPATAS